ncbi:MAG: GTP-dependent dephospho-CoA kinase family protein [Candidatus Bathycorpusculaceae bacterium]
MNMGVTYSLTPELRRKLKEPIGELIRGSFAETMKAIKGVVEKEKPPYIISVGDRVSNNLVRNHILPKLMIVDNKVMRKSIQPTPLAADKLVNVQNPPGTITDEAVTAIQEALKNNYRTKITVRGEEDLLTLIAILHAKENAFVVYGQPREGVVIVRVTPEKKAEITGILKAMENFRKTK